MDAEWVGGHWGRDLWVDTKSLLQMLLSKL